MSPARRPPRTPAHEATGRVSAAETTHVALLRGINVGGKNKLVMSALVALFGAAGCREVRTYIQSGNVVFRAASALAARLADELQRRIQREHGLSVPVVLRTADELEHVVRGNPFLRAKGGASEEFLHVAFLANEPARSALATLDPRRSPPDEFEVRGREIYLRCPNGIARTKLTNAYFDARLATTSTLRNWRTVRKLLELARA